MSADLLDLFLSQGSSLDSMTSTPLSKVDVISDLPYHQHIKILQADFPHLRSLLLYSEAIEQGRAEGRLGSHDSDSILVAEISSDDQVYYDRIDCYKSTDLHSHHDALSGIGDANKTRMRILLVEDLSPGAIEALGHGFRLDPHVFYFHLGFDTRRSAMRELVDPLRESMIPVTWYMPNHGPSNLVSIPLPRDLKSSATYELSSAFPLDRTYAKQAYSPLAELSSGRQDWQAPRRAYHRLSLVSPNSSIATILIFAFPTWKRFSTPQPGSYVLDSFGYPLVPLSSSSLRPELSDTEIDEKNESLQRNGMWSEGQWERVEPLFQTIFQGATSESLSRLSIRESTLLWLYSKVNENNYLAGQNEARCWRDVRALVDPGRIAGHKPQRSKRLLRDSMTKSTELMEISKSTLDAALGNARDQDSLRMWQRKVEVLITYQKARIAQLLLNVNDEQSEVQMDLMVSQLEENRYAIEQAKTVTRLNKLAFIFVPLATVCSAFGMNVSELDRRPSIWWFIWIAMLTTLTGAVMASNLLAKVSGSLTTMMKRTQRPTPDEE